MKKHLSKLLVLSLYLFTLLQPLIVLAQDPADDGDGPPPPPPFPIDDYINFAILGMVLLGFYLYCKKRKLESN